MTYQNRYECDDCGFTGNEDEFPEARKLSMRLTPGGAYTDRECPECECLAFPVKTPEDEANARLLATAPDLLAALRALVISIENVDFSPLDGVYDQIPWAQAEAAIAKATTEHTGEAHDDRYYDKHCHPDSCDETCDNYPCELCQGCACCEVKS